MGYRNFATIKIALIGTGTNVENYAMHYISADHEVLIAWNDGADKSVSPGLAAHENVTVCSIEEAAELADFIIIATPPKDVREVAYWLGDVRKKIIIDATANSCTSADEQVNTLLAIKAITGSQHVVKVFSTQGYEHMLKPLFGHEKQQLIMVGDSPKAKMVAKLMAENLDIHTALDMGGSDAAPLFNEMTRAWQRLALPKDQTLIAVNTIRI